MASTEGKPWSLRTRLLWQLVLAIGLLLGGLFLALDVLIDRAMYHQLDQFLASRAAALGGQLEKYDAPLKRILPAWDIAGHTDFFAIYDRNGRLQAASMNSGEGPQQLPSEQRGNITLPDGHAGRYIVLPLQHGRFAGSRLVLASERESWDQTEREMHGVLTLGFVSTLLAAVLITLLLVRRAFLHMQREAQRLPHDRPPEPGPLASTPRELQPFVEATHAALRTSWGMAERERRLSRNVAHELRTPVAEIAAVTELACQQHDPAALQQALNTVQMTNARMQRGIEALLALARFESGQEAPQTDPLDLTTLLRQLLKGQSLPAERIQAVLPAEAWVVCDAGMLERIVANLLHNALEYGDPESPVLLRVLQHKQGWCVQISNRAVALTEADLAHFGERHWRGERSADASHAGLGLALAQTMAQALNLQLQFALHQGELQATLGTMPALQDIASDQH